MTRPPAAVRRELLKHALWSIPIAVVGYLAAERLGSVNEHPRAVAAVLVALAITVGMLARGLRRQGRLVLGGGFLLFFLSYCLLFSIAAATGVLSGKQTALAGYEEEVPSNPLGLGPLGDWRYWLAPKAEEAHDLVIVTLPSFGGRSAAEAREIHAGLIRTAVEKGAKGIAFDYYFQGGSVFDPILCFWADSAVAAGVPVFFGYRAREVGGEPVRDALPTSLSGCFPDRRLGTLVVYQEHDGEIRMVPRYFKGDRGLPSLSHRIADALVTSSARLRGGAAGAGESGAGGRGAGGSSGEVELLQYLEPRAPITTLEGEPGEEQKELFRDRFVVVGSYRTGDSFETPFGRLQGVTIHAYAAHGLRSGQYIRRLGEGWSFLGMFGLPFILAVVQSRGGGRKALVRAALILGLLVIAGAAAAIRFALLWVDIAYPILSIAGMTGLLLPGARVQAGRLRLRGTTPGRTPEPGVVDAGRAAEDRAITGATDAALGTPAVGEPFDTFLAHNGEDKPVVRELADALRARAIKVWLDEDELVPGRDWQAAIEEVLETVRTAAILVGPDGLGPWERHEMRGALSECVDREMPVIPVLLPGAAAKPDLPLFLKAFTWVDLRGGLTDTGLDRLEWGITGTKP